MARKKKLATAAFAIAGVLGTLAIANAAAGEGPRWPTLSEPQWPNIPGQPGYRASVVTPAPTPAPDPVVTGSVRSEVAARWHNFNPPPPISAITGEFGLRYWYSWNKTAKNLYDIPGTAMVSRLTYDEMHGHSAEGFGRVDHTSGFFIKGTLGAGILVKGNLNDEDFPPFVVPYSSTDSEQREGHLAYASADFGFNLIWQKGLRVGAFAGYDYLDQEVNAYGCMQIVATGSGICGGGIPDDVLVISQNNQWHSLRIGLDAAIKLADRLSLRLDAAWLPYVKLNGSDSHWLRIGTTPGSFTGPVPEDGQGRGYQLQAALSYAATPQVSFAIGARYWRMDAKGLTHFEDHVAGVSALPQPVDWKVESLGVFVQGSFKFGPYPTGGIF